MFAFKTLCITSALLGMTLADPLRNDCIHCENRVTECGEPWGGCWNICDNARQEFQVPNCFGGGTRTQVCEYFINACGETYGACYPAEGPIPAIAEPPCFGHI